LIYQTVFVRTREDSVETMGLKAWK